MEQVYCCRQHADYYLDLVTYGQRILFDTTYQKWTHLCSFIKNNLPCQFKAKYYITLTAKYEAPPLPESVARILDKNIEIQAKFLKDMGSDFKKEYNNKYG